MESSHKLPSVKDLFILTFHRLKSRYRAFLVLVWLPILLNILFSFVFLRFDNPNAIQNLVTRIYALVNSLHAASNIPVFVVGGILLILAWLISSSVSGFFYIYAMRILANHRTESFKKDAIASLRLIPAYIPLLALSLVITAGGFALLIIPGIVFSLWFSLSIAVLVLEEPVPYRALLRSKQLISLRFWQSAVRIGCITIAVGLAQGLLSMLLALFFANSNIQGVLDSLLYYIFFWPFTIQFHIILFEKLRSIHGEESAGTQLRQLYPLLIVGILGLVAAGSIIWLIYSPAIGNAF